MSPRVLPTVTDVPAEEFPQVRNDGGARTPEIIRPPTVVKYIRVRPPPRRIVERRPGRTTRERSAVGSCIREAGTSQWITPGQQGEAAMSDGKGNEPKVEAPPLAPAAGVKAPEPAKPADPAPAKPVEAAAAKPAPLPKPA